VRGALPIFPAATVLFVNKLGSKTNPSMRGLCVLKGAVRFGWPGSSKVECGVQLLDIRLGGNANGEAALKGENARHFPAIQNLAFESLILRNGQVPNVMNTKRCRASKFESP